MADNVIKEFLVSLGFKSEGADDFEASLTTIQAKAVALGEAMYDTAKAVVEAVAHMAEGLDQLYWQTQRLGSSAADIRAYGYALSQLGGSAAGAQSSLENIAEFMRATPGAAGWLKGLGVSDKDFGNAQAVARDLEHAFQHMPYAQAKQYAAVIGIDPLTLQAMDRDTGVYEERYKDFAKNLGINLDEVAGKSNEFMTNLREMKAEFGLMFDYAAYKLLEWMLPKLEALAQWIRDMASGKVTGLSLEVRTLITDLGRLLEAMEHLALSDAGHRFAETFLWAFDNVVRAVTQVTKVIDDLMNRQWHKAWVDASTDPTRPWSDVGQPDAGATPQVNTGFKNGIGGTIGYFMSQGFSAQQAQGIRAGIIAESGGDPNAINKKSGAYGLGQWLGARKAKLFSLYGPNPTATQQLQFLAWELNGGDRGGASVRGQSSAAAAMHAYLADFMRPGAGLAGDLRRGSAALGNPFASPPLGGSGGVQIVQKTDIHAYGGNAKEVADNVASHQDLVNQRLVATAGVFAY